MGALITFGLVVACGLWLRAQVLRGQPRAYKYRPMHLIVGTPGSGKSYTLTYRAIESLAYGRAVRLNFALLPERVFAALRIRYGLSEADARDAVRRISYFRTWEDYVDAYDLDAYVDECQDVYRSTDWHSVPPEFITWNAQHRHRLCTITLASHRFGAIHNYVREGLISNIYLAKPAMWLTRLARTMSGNRFPLIKLLEIKDEQESTLPGASKRGGLLYRFFRGSSYPLDPIIANCYDHVGGVFPSPLDLQRRDTGKAGLVLKPRVAAKQRSHAVDGMPFLSPEEHAEAMRDGVAVHDVLASSLDVQRRALAA